MRSAAGAPATADAAALLELAGDSSLRQRFATATQLLQLAAAAVEAPPSSADDLALLVQAGEGLLDCGEVQLAAKLLRYTQAFAPPKRKLTPDYAAVLSAAGAALACAVASDGSAQPEEQTTLIEAASKAIPRPDLQWYLWVSAPLQPCLDFRIRKSLAHLHALLVFFPGNERIEVPAEGQRTRGEPAHTRRVGVRLYENHNYILKPRI